MLVADRLGDGGFGFGIGRAGLERTTAGREEA